MAVAVPMGLNSAAILDKGHFTAILCASPFNGYYSATRVIELVAYAKANFYDFRFVLASGICHFTLQGLGYSPKAAVQIGRAADNKVRNKVKKALMDIQGGSLTAAEADAKITLLPALLDHPVYLKFYYSYQNKYAEDPLFSQACLKFTCTVLQQNQHYNESMVISEANQNVAVQYLLYELPICLNIAEILDLGPCLYVYHTMSDFFRQIREDAALVSKNQGFLLLKL